MSRSCGSRRPHERARVEEHRVVLCQLQLHAMVGEVGAKRRRRHRDVARLVALRIWQIERRAAFERHCAVRDRTLQREDRRKPVDVRRVTLHLDRRHEAEMVVAVRDCAAPPGFTTLICEVI